MKQRANQIKYGKIKAANFVKSWLEKNETKMYSAQNKGKSVVAEKFISTLKKNCKYMTSMSKNV